MLKFTRWYNYARKHSKQRFVTPYQRHTGQDQNVLAKRKEQIEAAKAAPTPQLGKTRSPELHTSRTDNAKPGKRVS